MDPAWKHGPWADGGGLKHRIFGGDGRVRGPGDASLQGGSRSAFVARPTDATRTRRSDGLALMPPNAKDNNEAMPRQ